MNRLYIFNPFPCRFFLLFSIFFQMIIFIIFIIIHILIILDHHFKGIIPLNQLLRC